MEGKITLTKKEFGRIVRTLEAGLDALDPKGEMILERQDDGSYDNIDIDQYMETMQCLIDRLYYPPPL